MLLYTCKIQGMDIEIWSVGKENEAFIEPGIEYYFRKTRPYNPVQLVTLQLPKKAATTDIACAGIDHGEGPLCSDGSIESVTAFLEHEPTCLACQRMS